MDPGTIGGLIVLVIILLLLLITLAKSVTVIHQAEKGIVERYSFDGMRQFFCYWQARTISSVLYVGFVRQSEYGYLAGRNLSHMYETLEDHRGNVGSHRGVHFSCGPYQRRKMSNVLGSIAPKVIRCKWDAIPSYARTWVVSYKVPFGLCRVYNFNQIQASIVLFHEFG